LLPQRGGTNVPLGAGGSTHALGAAASTALGVGAAASATDDLETKLRRVEAERDELRRKNEDLERNMDEHGKGFMEEIYKLETKVSELQAENEALKDAVSKGSDEDLRKHNERLEREARDVIQQLDEFEKEKEEELNAMQEDLAKMQDRLAEQEQIAESARRRANELERERESLLEIMTDEGQELRARLDKALRDKEALSLDLGRAQARADMAAQAAESAGGQGSEAMARELSEANTKLRAAVWEKEALKDDVTNKDSQNVLLKSKLESAERKLKLADYEAAVLKKDLEDLRRHARPYESIAAVVSPGAEPPQSSADTAN